jgi:ethanolamine-phosphate phospho-lyase
MAAVMTAKSAHSHPDLALRLARAHTGHDDVIVVDRAYHGHTCAVIDISPYKYHKLADGHKPHIHEVPCPDTYRGQHKACPDQPGQAPPAFIHCGC